METIYVMEPGAYIRRDGNALKLLKAGQVISNVPAEDLKRLILVGHVSLIGAVLDYLIQRRVETVFMTPTGRFRARLGIDEHRHVVLRKAQYRNLGECGFAAEAARRIVAGKIQNMIRFLLLRGRQYENDILRSAAAGIKILFSRLEKTEELEQIRGFEGAAARIYFQSFGRLIRNDRFAFNGRNRRPPLDPVNALLSFVYTLLTNEVLSAIKAVGLDPYMGSLHDISYGRPSLACDLVEEYRVFLGDRMVLGLINRRAVTPDDFIYRRAEQNAYIDETEMRNKRPVEMRPPIMRSFLSAYENMMNRTIDSRLKWWTHDLQTGDFGTGPCFWRLSAGSFKALHPLPLGYLRMFYLVCFDITDDRIRYRVVKALKSYGLRVQKSVFECSQLSEESFLKMKNRIEDLIDHAEDSVRYYHICRGCVRRVEFSGFGELPMAGNFRVV